jgi:hypothetical protein
MAFIDMGDQFIALAAGRTQPRDQANRLPKTDAAREELRGKGVTD